MLNLIVSGIDPFAPVVNSPVATYLFVPSSIIVPGVIVLPAICDNVYVVPAVVAAEVEVVVVVDEVVVACPVVDDVEVVAVVPSIVLVFAVPSACLTAAWALEDKPFKMAVAFACVGALEYTSINADAASEAPAAVLAISLTILIACSVLILPLPRITAGMLTMLRNPSHAVKYPAAAVGSMAQKMDAIFVLIRLCAAVCLALSRALMMFMPVLSELVFASSLKIWAALATVIFPFLMIAAAADFSISLTIFAAAEASISFRIELARSIYWTDPAMSVRIAAAIFAPPWSLESSLRIAPALVVLSFLTIAMDAVVGMRARTLAAEAGAMALMMLAARSRMLTVPAMVARTSVAAAWPLSVFASSLPIAAACCAEILSYIVTAAAVCSCATSVLIIAAP